MKRFVISPTPDQAAPQLRIVAMSDQLKSTYRDNWENIARLNGRAALAALEDPDVMYSHVMDEWVEQEIPDLAVAINGFRTSLDYLRGRTLSWWHYLGPKPVRRAELELVEGLVEGETMIEDGYAYFRYGGTVTDVQVGFNDVFGSFQSFVGVEHPREDVQVYHPFEAMYGIEVT